MAKMTEQQRRDYRLYRAECRVSNVEPVLKDFLAGEMPEYILSLLKPEAASAATAGR